MGGGGVVGWGKVGVRVRGECLPPSPRRILTEKPGWLGLRGGIISLTLSRGELIIYVRNRVDNDPAIFTGLKNDPAIRSMA